MKIKVKVLSSDPKAIEAFFGPFKKKPKKDYKNMRERPLPKPESKRAHKTEYQLRPAHADQTEAVTEEQFKKWPSQKQRQWLKDHPNSKWGKDAKPSSDKQTKPATKSPVPGKGKSWPKPKTKAVEKLPEFAKFYKIQDARQKNKDRLEKLELRLHDWLPKDRRQPIEQKIRELEKTRRKLEIVSERNYSSMIKHMQQDPEQYLGHLQPDSNDPEQKKYDTFAQLHLQALQHRGGAGERKAYNRIRQLESKLHISSSPQRRARLWTNVAHMAKQSKMPPEIQKFARDRMKMVIDDALDQYLDGALGSID